MFGKIESLSVSGIPWELQILQEFDIIYVPLKRVLGQHYSDTPHYAQIQVFSHPLLEYRWSHGLPTCDSIATEKTDSTSDTSPGRRSHIHCIFLDKYQETLKDILP